jgi:hypothetical protein
MARAKNIQTGSRQSRQPSAMLWNVLTGLVLLTAICLMSVFAVIFVNPDTPLNPFPPPTLPAVLLFPTNTPPPLIVLPPTWTPTPTAEPTMTFTPAPTHTPTSTPTLLVLPSPTETPSLTPTAQPRFTLVGGVRHLRAGSVVSGRTCAWMGVGGNVTDLEDNPVTGLTVLLGGEYEGKAIRMTATTGTASAYGAGGFEITIANDPNPSRETIYLQLFTPGGTAISDRFFFRTYDECDRNLIRMDFTQLQ